MDIASLVLGIISIIFGSIPICGTPFLFTAILGLILGIIHLVKQQSGSRRNTGSAYRPSESTLDGGVQLFDQHGNPVQLSFQPPLFATAPKSNGMAITGVVLNACTIFIVLILLLLIVTFTNSDTHWDSLVKVDKTSSYQDIKYHNSIVGFDGSSHFKFGYDTLSSLDTIISLHNLQPNEQCRGLSGPNYPEWYDLSSVVDSCSVFHFDNRKDEYTTTLIIHESKNNAYFEIVNY